MKRRRKKKRERKKKSRQHTWRISSSVFISFTTCSGSTISLECLTRKVYAFSFGKGNKINNNSFPLSLSVIITSAQASL